MNKKNLYKGFFEINELSFIHQRHDGVWSKELRREIFSGAQVSALLPYDPTKKEILLIQQFRAGIISRYKESYLYEIVAGIIDKNENLYVNEIAPRVHNSGHLTINSHNISQFENHIRAVCALEKRETKKLFSSGCNWRSNNFICDIYP